MSYILGSVPLTDVMGPSVRWGDETVKGFTIGVVPIDRLHALRAYYFPRDSRVMNIAARLA